MQRTQIAGVVVILLLLPGLSLAQEELLDEPRQIEQITFSPPASASIRLTNGVRRTGKIVSISRESMVYQVGRDNNEVSAEIDDIQRVNTLDNEFTYEPANEDFERLKIKARRVSYIRVETVETYVPPPGGVSRPEPPTSTLSDPPVVPTPPAVSDPPSVTDPAVPDVDPEMRPEQDPSTAPSPSGTTDLEIPTGEPQPGDLILFCSNCNNRLPLSIKNGDHCPHCGIQFWNTPTGGAGEPRPQGRNGGGGGGGNTEPGDYPTGADPDQGGGGSAGDQPAEGGGQVVARSTGLGDLPLWMQVGFFVGLLAVGWVVLQRR